LSQNFSGKRRIFFILYSFVKDEKMIVFGRATNGQKYGWYINTDSKQGLHYQPAGSSVARSTRELLRTQEDPNERLTPNFLRETGTWRIECRSFSRIYRGDGSFVGGTRVPVGQSDSSRWPMPIRHCSPI
jgi:hypothetical protein